MESPHLIIIGGFAGAGKTTIANRLAKEYSLPIFSSDSINDSLRSTLHMSFHEVSPFSYELMWHMVKIQLSNGVSVIVDTHMAAERVWESVDSLKLAMPQVHVLPIILQASLATHRERVEERGRTNKKHLNLGGDSFEDVIFKYDFIESLERTDIVRVNANHEHEAVYKEVKHQLKKYF